MIPSVRVLTGETSTLLEAHMEAYTEGRITIEELQKKITFIYLDTVLEYEAMKKKARSKSLFNLFS